MLSLQAIKDCLPKIFLSILEYFVPYEKSSNCRVFYNIFEKILDYIFVWRS